MKRKHRRLLGTMLGLGCLCVAAALALLALGDKVSFFYTPAELVDPAVLTRIDGRAFQLGGLVETGSLVREDPLAVRFAVTDNRRSVAVRYRGLLPDLFREGQGVVASGRLQADGSFLAETLLAKHDENYMPPPLAAKLQEAGHPSAPPGAPPAGSPGP